MKKQKTIYLLSLFCALMILAVSAGWAQSKSGPEGPVILSSHALARGRYGTIWKIYIEAEAGSADMAKIAAVVEQPGYGRYPTDFVQFKPSFGRHLLGYLQWNTFSSKGKDLSDGDQIVLRVSVIDKAGKESNEAIFPFTFMSGVRGQGNLPVTFHGGNVPRLGYIDIDLITPDGPDLPG